jgi:TonB family protein
MSSETIPASPRRRGRETWPLAAAGAAVLLTLAAVHALLHPRKEVAAGRSGEEIPATVTADRVELRREADPGSVRVSTLAPGARVRIVSESGRWVEVVGGAGRGYVPVEAVERDEDRSARQRRANELLALPPVFGVVAADTDVSLAPYPLAARGGRLARGSVVAIHSVDHSYFAFEDKTWGIAYVPSAEVDLVPPDPKLPAIAPAKTRALKDLTIVDLQAEPPPEEEPAVEEASPLGGAAPSPEPPGRALPPVAAVPEGGIEPPALISKVEPDYPDAARRAGVEGTVELEISIDASGRVTRVEVLRGLPLGLSEAAADAVRQWVYRPARNSQGPIASRKLVRIRFELTLGTPR